MVYVCVDDTSANRPFNHKRAANRRSRKSAVARAGVNPEKVNTFFQSVEGRLLAVLELVGGMFELCKLFCRVRDIEFEREPSPSDYGDCFRSRTWRERENRMGRCFSLQYCVCPRASRRELLNNCETPSMGVRSMLPLANSTQKERHDVPHQHQIRVRGEPDIKDRALAVLDKRHRQRDKGHEHEVFHENREQPSAALALQWPGQCRSY